MLEPRAATVEPAMMMEQLFKLSELETRISVNMNVLVDGVTPRVVVLGEALQQWLDHRREVLHAPLAPSARPRSSGGSNWSPA